jgi:glyoxylase-like metal-dependent hydrolase (beta-lactamase superfamily II)
MDKIAISDNDVAPLDDLTTDVKGLRILFVNVFALASKDGWALIDAGLHFSAPRIRKWAESHFGEGTQPGCIILTHGHFDHVGAIDELGWDVPIYAHSQEMPYLTGRLKYPPPDPTVGGGLMAVMSPLYPRGPYNFGERIHALPEDGTLQALPGWKWIHTPGHTAGHVSLFRESDRLLVVGDAFCTTKPESFLMAAATYKAELHGPPSYYTPDWEQAKMSVQKLAELKPQVLAPGHGKPLAGSDIPEKLEALARDFDRIAKPEHGRYVA